MHSWLITDPKTLRGTAYFEFLPGRYQDQCWGPNSVFLDEERFGYIEPIFMKHVSSYDHYSFVAVGRSSWRGVLSDLAVLGESLDTDPSRVSLTTHVRDFSQGSHVKTLPEQGREELRLTVGELSAWVEKKLRDFEVITVLGM